MTDLLEHLRAALGPDGVSADPVDRRAYGHDTFPLALKPAGEGRPAYEPDMIAFPRNADEVATVVRLARAAGTPVVPFGGGSGIVGGALAVRGGVMVDLKHLAAVEEIDPISRLVAVGAGINGQRLEDYLNERGYTTGHYPQSLRSSTLGGWIAHRAIGTASTRYGGIEALVAGMDVVLPTGEFLRLRPSPRGSTGPDLRQLFLGGEGTLGIVTQATLRIRPLPAARAWLVFVCPDFAAGLDAIRRTVQGEYRPAVVRLYDAEEGAHLLEGVPHAPGACLLLLSCEGEAEQVDWESAQIRKQVGAAGATEIGSEPAERWWAGRFNTAGLLHTLRAPLGIADALEVAAPWRALPALYAAMRADMRAALGLPDRPGAVYGHTSHAYLDGANLYMIFHGQAASPADVAPLYGRVLDAAFQACTRHGGTLSHHHGIGLGKARWMELEYGAAGLGVLRAVQRALDPDGILNPGKIGAAP
jgi:alkyldihydroxyacetonephosphate synthase